jgi:hypothetical protein
LRRRLEILWKNENPQQGLDSIRIIGESQWTAGRGLKLGLTVDEVEALNQVPFEIRNFNLEYGGAVTSWHGGALSKVPGGCRLAPGFAPTNGTTANAYQKIGYDDLLSNNPDLGALRLRIIGIVIHYRN